MFEAIRDLTEKVKQLDEGKLTNIYISDNTIKEFILDLNRVEQLFKEGIQSDGSPLTSSNSTPGYYSSFTEQLNAGITFTYKGESKQKIFGEPYFLYNEGKFFSTFVLIPLKDGFEIQANPQRDNTNILDEFGQNVIGLTDESLQIFIDAFKEVIPDLIRKELGLL